MARTSKGLPPMEPVAFYIPGDLNNRLNEYAEKTQINKSAIARMALIQYFDALDNANKIKAS